MGTPLDSVASLVPAVHWLGQLVHRKWNVASVCLECRASLLGAERSYGRRSHLLRRPRCSRLLCLASANSVSIVKPLPGAAESRASFCCFLFSALSFCKCFSVLWPNFTFVTCERRACTCVQRCLRGTEVGRSTMKVLKALSSRCFRQVCAQVPLCRLPLLSPPADTLESSIVRR